MEDVYKQAADRFSLVYTAAYYHFPFIASFLYSNLRVVLTEEIKEAKCDKDTIYINPKWFLSLSDDTALFSILHLALHIMLFDAYRFELLEARQKEVWNIACDTVNNSILSEMLLLPENAITYDDCYIPRDIRGNKEEIFKYLLKYWKYGLPKDGLCHNDLTDNTFRQQIENDNKSVTIMIGGNWEKLHNSTMEEYRYNLSRALTESATLAKQIGNLPRDVQRLVDELIGGKVNWKNVFKAYNRSYFVRFTRQSWKKPPRRRLNHPYKLPNYETYIYPDVWMIIDTSGSISQKELTAFLSEVFSASEFSKSTIRVVFFDTEAYGPYTVRTPQDVYNLKPKGGGGTDITKALKLVLDNCKDYDYIIIFTDGYVDCNREVVEHLTKIKERVVICTTAAIPFNELKSKTIKLDVGV